jgi:WD40 repeat protein
MLVSASTDDALKLWSVAGNRQVATLEGHSDNVNDVIVSADGKLIASAGADRAVCLWSLPDCRLLAVLEGHAGAVNRMAMTPDSKLLVTCAPDSSGRGRGALVRLWSTDQGRLAGTLAATSTVQSLLISPDGKLLVAGADDGAILVYDLERREFRGFLFDPAAGGVDGITYNVLDKVTGRTITYTMPCGSPIPPGATCICNCVPSTGSFPSAPSGGRIGGTYCTCNRICTCVPVYRRR